MTASAGTEPLNALPLFVTQEEGKLFMAMKMFELGKLSLAQAAAVAGYSLRGFMDVISHHGVPVVDYPATDLATEISW